MIFQNVNNLLNNTDRSYFKEKIDIYIKIVEAICKRNNVLLPIADEIVCFNKMKEMGIVESVMDLKKLKQVLTKDKFDEFIYNILAEVMYRDMILLYV